ncbi:MAG TPA: hypothetical protein VJQ08_02485, partial [Candidatus Dormibacteraeota bacterium]|nr:hypothetical protein [Candidatus Dormibacteraeota bacterium]
GALDELALFVARRVAHWPFSPCMLKRRHFEAGYAFATSRRLRLSSQPLNALVPAGNATTSCGQRIGDT